MSDNPIPPIEDKDSLSEEYPSTLQFYAYTVIQKNLHALQREIPGVREGKDLEYIHRLRVASRRLRNALTVFGEQLPQKKTEIWVQELGKTSKALNRVRDLDVQILLLDGMLIELDRKLRLGLHRLETRLKQKRANFQKQVYEALDELEKSQLLHRIEKKLQLPKSSRKLETSPEIILLASSTIEEKLNVFLSWAPSLNDEHAEEAHHAMRIAAKNLRYTMETFQPALGGRITKHLSAIKECQQVLGEIHDCDMWMRFLPKFMESEKERALKFYGQSQPFRRVLPGLIWFQENRKSERNRLFNAFSIKWRKWQQHGFWEKLNLFFWEMQQTEFSNNQGSVNQSNNTS